MVSVRPLNRKSTTILIAAVLALGTGLLAFNYLSSLSKSGATIVQQRTVVVATQDIPARTVIAPAMITTTVRPVDGSEPDAIADASVVSGQIALITIPSGATLSSSKIGHLNLGGLPVRIPRGERAMSIALDHVKGVADLMRAGDRVDVIAETPAHGAGVGPTVATILRNKLVLAMGTTLEEPIAAGASPAPEADIQTATLAVTPAEAKTLFLADTNATLRLALRSNKDGHSNEAPDAFVIPTEVVRAVPAVSPAAAVAREAPHVRVGPPIIDGDKLVN